jgi:hypothetical protein
VYLSGRRKFKVGGLTSKGVMQPVELSLGLLVVEICEQDTVKLWRNILF